MGGTWPQREGGDARVRSALATRTVHVTAPGFGVPATFLLPRVVIAFMFTGLARSVTRLTSTGEAPGRP